MDDNINKHNSIKNELSAIYDHNSEGIHNRSKCDWYEHSRKLTKFFSSLEKQRESQNTINNLLLVIGKMQTRQMF